MVLSRVRRTKGVYIVHPSNFVGLICVVASTKETSTLFIIALDIPSRCVYPDRISVTRRD